MNITLKNIPQEVYRAIKQDAHERGRSLNSQLIQVLECEAAEIRRRGNLRKLRREVEQFAASLTSMDDSTPLIRRDRQR